MFRLSLKSKIVAVKTAPTGLLTLLNEEKPDMKRETNSYMRCSEGLEMPGVSDLHQREVTRDHGPIKALLSFELNRNLSANMRRARLFGYSLRLAYSG